MFINSINSLEKDEICLTFDDGPDPVMTPKILDILNKYNIQANFFLIGMNSHNHKSINVLVLLTVYGGKAPQT